MEKLKTLSLDSLRGSQKYRSKKNKCYKDISIIKGDIILAFKEVLNAIMNNRSEIISSLTKVVDLLMEHKDISSYCRFGKLGISIGFLYSKLSLTYTYNIYKEWTQIVEHVKGFYNGFESNNLNQSGRELGFLVKIVFEYSTK
jgi:hypothetical protein